jgi:hypothetical protein
MEEELAFMRGTIFDSRPRCTAQRRAFERTLLHAK